MPKYPALTIVAVLTLLSACNKPPQEVEETAINTPVAESEEAKQKALAKQEEDCKAQTGLYEQRIKIGDNWGAAEAIRICANTLADKKMLDQLKGAELKGYAELINDKTNEPRARIIAIDNLASSYPEKAAEFAKLREGLAERESRDSKIDAAKAERKEAARRKKEGVSIGMSRQEVIASNWGKPQKINRTVSAQGEHEQWVYDGGYLYFQDGRLTTIQN